MHADADHGITMVPLTAACSHRFLTDRGLNRDEWPRYISGLPYVENLSALDLWCGVVLDQGAPDPPPRPWAFGPWTRGRRSTRARRPPLRGDRRPRGGRRRAPR
jgi:hypothetical protein